MEEYRHGVVLVRPPEPLASRYDELRARHDPHSAAIAPCHVSLSSPLPRGPTAEELRELRDLLAGIDPVELHLGTLRVPAPHPGVVVDVSPEPAFRALQTTVHSWSLFEGVVHRRLDVPPHLTIAEFLSLEESHALAEQLAPLVAPATFLCDELTLLVPDGGFHLEPRATFQLGAVERDR